MSNNAKVRIIAVMPHAPAYSYHSGSFPENYWKKSDGGIVGFWSNEWMDVLGAEVLKNTDRYSWEVWQPDYKADKIYSKQIESGVTHKLFPAADQKYGRWPLTTVGLESVPLISSLEELDGERVIVMLYGTFGFRRPIYMEVLRAMCRARKIPVFLRSGGMFKAPLSELLEVHRPLTYFSILAEHLSLKKLLRRADVISEQSTAGLAELKSIYGGRVEKLTMGCDFGFWIPPPSAAEKEAARKHLGIKPGKKVFFASGNFVPRKQLDKLLEVFLSLGRRDDFFILIAGHGEAEQTGRLSALAAPLSLKECAMLHPYVSGEELRRLYWAADVYVSVATDEGGPASVMKAMACGLPVLSTRAGATADELQERGAGLLLNVHAFSEWADAIRSILSGRVPPVLDRASAAEAYDWPMVAARFIRIYDNLVAEYFGGAG